MGEWRTSGGGKIKGEVGGSQRQDLLTLPFQLKLVIIRKLEESERLCLSDHEGRVKGNISK